MEKTPATPKNGTKKLRPRFPKNLLLAFLLSLPLLPSPLPAQEIRKAQPVNSQDDQQAKFLAGIPLPSDSLLLPLQSTASYLRHFQEFGKNWQRFQKDHFNPKRVWASSEITQLAPPAKILYYLFSGPDFITATALFPNAETYILVGLEQIGQVPPPQKLSDQQIADGLTNLRKSTETTLNFSFFITKDMKVDLDKTDFKGILPILYAFIALPGFEILESSQVSIDNRGHLQNGTGGSVAGVKIVFRDPAYMTPRTLFYFRGDLSDSGLAKPSAGLLLWMKSLPAGYAYLKAASYLLHEPSFSTARDFLLDHSTSILQDDSGIPLKYFSREKWSLHFYGSYMRPIELFDKKFQPDLRQAYEKETVRPLAFGTGYNWKPGESNLLLAVKKLPPAPPQTQVSLPPQQPGFNTQPPPAQRATHQAQPSHQPLAPIPGGSSQAGKPLIVSPPPAP